MYFRIAQCLLITDKFIIYLLNSLIIYDTLVVNSLCLQLSVYIFTALRIDLHCNVRPKT